MSTANITLGEEVPPDPASLAESLRDFGYTLPTALADLLDNSLAAEATDVQIQLEAVGVDSHIAVIDNGRGMTTDELKNAMRMGTSGPLVARRTGDLGRFGLGLKTASLSQGRCVTVITKVKTDPKPTIRRWDLRHIASSKWQLLTNPADAARGYVDSIASASQGTAVVIEDLDRSAFLRGDPARALDHLGHALEAVRLHLSMVFHRFIEEGKSIRVGSTALRPWNPFLTHKSTKLATETLRLHGFDIPVTPYVLPHHSRLSDIEHYESGLRTPRNGRQLIDCQEDTSLQGRSQIVAPNRVFERINAVLPAQNGKYRSCKLVGSAIATRNLTGPHCGGTLRR